MLTTDQEAADGGVQNQSSIDNSTLSSNGLDERFNQTLSNSLAKFVQDNRERWDEKLRAIVYAYNSAVQVGSAL